eukprot:TRINITY_DN1842_c0_g2_i1.p1 TRINITY_DN1842_c0_g2~~TRINITY_DN1842_c0_g2_i1.p1  ORF type:complete len:310 (-),score=28.64 TRINITY_DN1842_c0_g2_i1:362-1231(-)
MASPRVRSQGGVYWMYYSGGDREEVEVPESLAKLGLGLGLGLGFKPSAGERIQGLRRRPGLAMSNDGKNWARIEGDHHSGALFDVGEVGDWDEMFVGSPQVIFHAPGDLRMYYNSIALSNASGSGHETRFVVGMARSRDGFKWVKWGKCFEGGGEGSRNGEFDEMGVGARHVVPDTRPGRRSGYLMAYEGVSVDGSRSIGLAESADGISGWKRVGTGPILEPERTEKSAWDAVSVGAPCLVDMGEGRWRLYYVGVGEDGEQGMGLAVATSDALTMFERWGGAKLGLTDT